MLFSIIVPVYNAEKYLRRCIESILAQTEGDFELLLVDDGSRDGSLAICQEYAATDSRIKAMHKENGGVSSARNHGLDNATGDYIMFVDADDYITPDTLEQCRPYTPEYDIVRFSAIWVASSESKWPFSIPAAKHRKQYIKQIISRKGILAVWGGVFRRDLFTKNDIRFNPNIAVGENWLVSATLAYHSKNIKSIPKAHCYIYDRSNESSCWNNMNVKRAMQQLEVVYLIRKIIPSGYNAIFRKQICRILAQDIINTFGLEESCRAMTEYPRPIATLGLWDIFLLAAGPKRKLLMLKVWSRCRQLRLQQK